MSDPSWAVVNYSLVWSCMCARKLGGETYKIKLTQKVAGRSVSETLARTSIFLHVFRLLRFSLNESATLIRKASRKNLRIVTILLYAPLPLLIRMRYCLDTLGIVTASVERRILYF